MCHLVKGYSQLWLAGIALIGTLEILSHGSPVVVLFDEKGKIFVYLGRRGKRGLPMLSILSNTSHHL